MITNALIKRSSLMVAMAVSFSVTSFAQKGEPTGKLEPGMAVPSLDLDGIQWVQGAPVKSLDEEGKVYMLECWATWCGPCIFAIPHVNELSQKFGDRGLVVIGMSSLEDKLDKVEKFVANQGDGMSYRVAFSGGRKSEFSAKWLNAAGVKGIPHTFIVKDGKLILMSHPKDIDDALIENLLAGDFDKPTFDARVAAKEAKEADFHSKVQPMIQNGQWAELEEFARTELNDNPDRQRGLLVIANANAGDWKDLSVLQAQPKAASDQEMLMIQCAFITPDGEGAEAFAKEALKTLTDDAVRQRNETTRRFGQVLARARFLWISGDHDGSKLLIKDYSGDLDVLDDGDRLKAEYTRVIAKLHEKLEGDEFPAITVLMRP